MKKILNKFLFIFVKTIAKILAWSLFRLKIEGRENLPQKAPFIVASNHTSFLDPGLVQVAIPFKLSWVAKKFYSGLKSNNKHRSDGRLFYPGGFIETSGSSGGRSDDNVVYQGIWQDFFCRKGITKNYEQARRQS